MTTITEILAEAFNRVKAEHGVTLSRVEFITGYGALANIEFSADGVVNMGYPPALLPSAPPSGATHFGTVGGYNDRYWKFEGGRLYVWDWVERWMLYDAGESAHRIVDSHLTPPRR